MINEQHVKDVCRPGEITCCRYLMMDCNGWECAKIHPDMKVHMDKRVTAGTMRATGDNCEGKNDEEQRRGAGNIDG